MAKKGAYRKLVTVEIVSDYSALKKGTVTEMHPVLANRLIAMDVAKTSKKTIKE